MRLQPTRALPQEIVRKQIRSHSSKRARVTESKIDIDELKDHLGLKDIVSSVEEMKALFHEVVGKRKLEASEPNTSKKARTEEASVPRADNSSSEYDPTDIVELSTLHQGYEEPFFPSVFDDSEVCGPKISEKLAARVNEACTKKVIESKMKDLEAKYHTPENCPNLCSSQLGSSSSGKGDKDTYNRGSFQGRARKPYFLNYGGRYRSRYRRESTLSSKSSSTTTK